VLALPTVRLLSVDPFEAVNTLLEGNRGVAAGVMTLTGALVVAFAVSKPLRLPEIHETTPIPMIDFTIRIFLSGAAISASAWAAVETLFVGGALSPSSREEVDAMLDAINSTPGLTLIVFLCSFFVYPLMIAVSRLREAKRLRTPLTRPVLLAAGIRRSLASQVIEGRGSCQDGRWQALALA
jgi:hypothetical protein